MPVSDEGFQVAMDRKRAEIVRLQTALEKIFGLLHSPDGYVPDANKIDEAEEIARVALNPS